MRQYDAILLATLSVTAIAALVGSHVGAYVERVLLSTATLIGG